MYNVYIYISANRSMCAIAILVRDRECYAYTYYIYIPKPKIPENNITHAHITWNTHCPTFSIYSWCFVYKQHTNIIIYKYMCFIMHFFRMSPSPSSCCCCYYFLPKLTQCVVNAGPPFNFIHLRSHCVRMCICNVCVSACASVCIYA